MNTRILTTTIAVLLTAASIHAQTWDGGGLNDSLATAANWNPDAVPGTTADVIFAGAVRLTPVVPGPFQFNSLTFNNTAGAFVFGGTSTLNIKTGGLTNNDTQTQTFNNPMGFGLTATSFINAASGSLTLNGTVGIGAATVTLDGANTITFGSTLTGTGTIVKSGTGVFNLTSTATAIGADLTLNVGTTTLVAGATQTFSTGSAIAVNNTAALLINESVVLDGAQLSKASGATVTFAAGESLTIQNAGSAAFTGTQVFNNAATLNVLSGGQLTSTGSLTIGAGGAATVNLTVDGAGSLLQAGSFSDWGGFSGTIVADFSNGASGTLSGGLRLGQLSSATSSTTVNVQTAAQLSIGTSLTIGPSATGAASSLTIDGTGSQATMTGPSFFVLGTTSGNTHSLTIQNGGTFTSGTGALTVNATGAVNLGGTGSVFNANGNMTVNGLFARTLGGTFNLAAGRTLTVQGGGDFANSTTYSHISASTVTVTGAGSTITANSSNQLRFSGGSTLNVLAGGQATAGGALFLAAGGDAGNTTVLVDGAGSLLSGGNSSVFAANGNTATVTFSNGASGTFGTSLQFANTNTIGTSANVSVLSGATLTAGSLNMGTVSSGTSVSSLLTIDGVGSAATVTGAVTIGASSTNTARLTIDHGGTFTHGGGFLLSPTGRVFLTDGTFNANGNVTVSGGNFTAGVDGSFNLAANRTLTVNNLGNASFADLLLLFNANSNVAVNGPSSQLSGGDFATLGSNTVTASSGGRVVFDSIVLGAGAQPATTLITGANSVMNTAVSLEIGNGTHTYANGATGTLGTVRIDAELSALVGVTGSLVVQSGAEVTSGNLRMADIGNSGGNTSVLTVTGAGSSYTQTGAATVRLGVTSTSPTLSTGTLNVADGGIFTSGTGSITLSGTGTINLDGGTLDLKGPLVRDGGALNFNAGELRIIDSWNVGGGGLLGANVTLDASRRMVTTANTIIDPFRTLTLNGGTLSTSALLNGGTLAFNSGTLAITGAGGFNIGTGALGANVTLGTGATLQVSQTTTINAGALLRLNGGVFTSTNVTNNGTIDVQNGTLNITGTLNNAAGSRLFVGGLSFDSSNVTNAGRITLLNGLAELGGTGTITNTGIITGDGTIGKALTNSAGGQVRAEAGRTLYLTGAVTANAGTYSLEGGTLEFTTAITNSATGTITGFGALRSALLTNEGNIGLSGDARFYGDVTNASGARIITSGGATTTFFDDVIHNGIEIRTSAGGASVFFGAVSGAGPFTGTGTVYFEGDLRPGNSPASVLYEGDLVFGGSSSLTLEIGGLLSGSQHDHLNVGGSLHADGDLVLALLGGFTPQFGDTFDLFDVGTFTGNFDSISAPALSGGNEWDFSSLKSTGTVTVVPEPGVATLLFSALGLLGWRRTRSSERGLAAR